MQTALLEPEDLFLICSEIAVVIGLFITLFLAIRIHKKHLGKTKGWEFIIVGLVFQILHGIFDVLDTLQFGSFMIELLNLFDGLTFVIGLVLFGIGIYHIATFGAKTWGLE